MSALLFCSVKEDVLAPPPENDDVVNDFDIEEEVIEVANRLGILLYTVFGWKVLVEFEKMLQKRLPVC